MLVKDRMNFPAVTVTPDIPFQDALKLMREKGFRRLPVVSPRGVLVGIVSERDLLYATPSPASSLSVWELNYLLSQLQVREIMTKHVVTTTPDTPIEDAAEVMATRKIGGMPVVDEHNYVLGVITETDIFKALVEMMAMRKGGVRLTLDVPERMGVLGEVATTIAEQGGNIMGVGVYDSDTPDHRRLLIKVQGVTKSQLVALLERLGDHVLDAREVGQTELVFA